MKVKKKKSKLIQNIMRSFVVLTAVFLMEVVVGERAYARKEEDRKKEENIGSLYAQSAVLIDADSGRILYEKNGQEFLANASTTKIMTCILALEKGNLKDVVTVSSYAASMPDVRLHIREGEEYYLGDLLYSLMLESHNDVAVAIAEHICGSQEKFSRLMNQKAKEIGCKNTVFLTPNGLDAEQKIDLTFFKQVENTKEKEGKILSHGTTAEDLAQIMRYCIKLSPQKEEFLKITGTPQYHFTNKQGNRSFSCRNHNSFLNMMKGALSGKTGFTGKAGYCYVGALEQEGKCYVVALLACGWPGNKNYKWSDCRKLMEYGISNYKKFDVNTLEKEYKDKLLYEVKYAKRNKLGEEKVVELRRKKNECSEILLKNQEKITYEMNIQELQAPLEQGQIVGKIEYYIEGEKWMEEELYCDIKIEKIDFSWCFMQILKKIA